MEVTTMYYLNDWINCFNRTQEPNIGVLYYQETNKNNSNIAFIDNPRTYFNDRDKLFINENNLFEASIYFTICQIIEPDYLNGGDSILFFNNNYKNDTIFKYNCLVYTFFHKENKASAFHGVNHWIPFTPQEIGVTGNFKSDFMSNFIKGKIFSKEASDLLGIGKKIFIYHHSGKVGETWIYHHSKRVDNSFSPKDRSQIRLIDTSFYDICDNLKILSIIDDKENRQAEESDNESYKAKCKNFHQNVSTLKSLIDDLNQKLSILSEKIKLKVYEFATK
jgi:hypothetical protein